MENELWHDAYLIAWIGASNPRGVRHTLEKYETQFPDHPAVRAIQGHLAFLEGTSLGPELDDLEAVRTRHIEREREDDA